MNLTETLQNAFPSLRASSISIEALQSANARARLIRAGGDLFVLKSYTRGADESSIAWEIQLLKWLSSRHPLLKVPQPMTCADGKPWLRDGDNLYTVHPFIIGNTLNYHSASDQALLAQTTAHLHIATLSSQNGDRPTGSLFSNPFAFASKGGHSPSSLNPGALGINDSSGACELIDFWNQEAGELEQFYQQAYKQLPSQICHNDLTSGNTLRTSETSSAVIDFEFCCMAPRALDIAMGLRMTMQTWRNDEPWEIAGHYAKCYREAGGPVLSGSEIEMMPLLLRLRSAMTILLRVSKPDEVHDSVALLKSIEFLRNTRMWLNARQDKFRDVLARCLGR